MASEMKRNGSKPHQHRVVVPCPERIRRIQGTVFGWLDARLHRRGWLQVLSAEAIATYAFLCLVADRQGVSFYRRDRIARELALSEEVLHVALERLKTLGLVAYRPFRPRAAEGFHQVLTLPPEGPPRFPPEMERLLASIHLENDDRGPE